MNFDEIKTFLHVGKPVFLIFFIFIGLIGFSTINKADPPPPVSHDLYVEGRVDFYPTIKTHPEKRIPLTNNWQNENVVEIRSAGSTIPLVTQLVSSDNFGTAVMNPVDVRSVPTGNYDISVKGLSHLKKVFPNNTFYANTVVLDFTAAGDELKAGDTSEVNDNYVNSLDISNTSRNLYSSSNIKNDLNRDGVVNSLDLSNIIDNLYQKGED